MNDIKKAGNEKTDDKRAAMVSFYNDVRNTLHPTLSDRNWKIFLHYLKVIKKSLPSYDPYSRGVIPVAYNEGKPTETLVFILTRNFFIQVLQQYPGFRMKSGVVYENDHFRKDGVMDLPDHSWNFAADRGALVGAWCAMTINEGKTWFYVEVYLREFLKNNDFWRDMPNNMIEKTSHIHCARLVLPGVFQENTTFEGMRGNDPVFIELPDGREIYEKSTVSPKVEEEKKKELSAPKEALLMELYSKLSTAYGAKVPAIIKEVLSADKPIMDFNEADYDLIMKRLRQDQEIK